MRERRSGGNIGIDGTAGCRCSSEVEKSVRSGKGSIFLYAAVCVVVLFVPLALALLVWGPGAIHRPVGVYGPWEFGPGEVVAGPGEPALPEVVRSVRNDTSVPLRSVEPVDAPGGWRPVQRPELPLPGREEGVEAGPLEARPAGAPDSVVQRVDTGPRMPAPAKSFEGISQANQLSQGFWGQPPDPNLDVGLNHIMQIVNFSYAVYDKSGGLLYGPASLSTMWSGFSVACQKPPGYGDPIVLYDAQAGRWLVSQFAMPNYPSGPFYECIAVSATPNPLGAWNRYQFVTSNTKMNDYPKIGMWPNGYYMTSNQFTGSSTWAGTKVVAFERSAMLTGNSALSIGFDMFGVDPNLAGALPPDLDGPTPPPTGADPPFLEMDDDGWGYPQDQLEVWEFHADWTTPANSTFTHVTDVPTAPFDSNLCNYELCVPQAGTTVKLDPIADRLMYRLQYRNFGSYQTLVTDQNVDANGNDRAGVRWYELRDTGSGWSVYQQGTYSPDSNSRWMGSAAMDGLGDIAVGYSVSSGSNYPSIAYAGHDVADPLGTLGQGEMVLASGGGSQTDSGGRWGDYSSMSVDPADDCTFWYTNEYYSANSTHDWRTRIGALRFAGCTTPADTTPPTGVAVTVPAKPFATGPFQVSWTATDTDSGVAYYDVSYRMAPYDGGFGSPVVWQADVIPTGATFTGSPGYTYCFSATATDNASNTSSPSSETCVAVPVDDVAMTASGTWTRNTRSGCYLGTLSRSSTAGSLLTLYRVNTDKVALIASKCRRCGVVEILWNGAPVMQVNLHAHQATKMNAFTVDLGSVQTGTAAVRVATQGKPVRIDGLGVGRV